MRVTFLRFLELTTEDKYFLPETDFLLPLTDLVFII